MHALSITKQGTAEMAYTGETPWHGLGQKLEAGASIAEWLTAANMNWTIRSVPVQYQASRADNTPTTWNDHRVLIRTDTGAPLGIVSPQYEVVQPHTVLEFFRDLVTDHGMQLETAGVLFGGARYWALAKMDDAVLSGWDRVGGYTLLSTSADGKFATEARETTVRVVCNNTLSIAVSQQPGAHYVRVPHRSRFDIKAVHAHLGLGREHFAKFVELANVLTTTKVSAAAAHDFVQRLLAPTLEVEQVAEEPAQAKRAPRGLETILALFDGGGVGSTQKGAEGTAWGLVNAVTEYVDHYATAKTVSHRLNNAWWGNGDKTKVKAFTLAVETLI